MNVSHIPQAFTREGAFNTKTRLHPCTTKQFRIDHIWICMNAPQPQKLTSKHQSKEDTGKNVYHRMVAPGPLRDGGLKSFKAFRSKYEALSLSIGDWVRGWAAETWLTPQQVTTKEVKYKMSMYRIIATERFRQKKKSWIVAKQHLVPFLFLLSL